jgi:hypothetical protein
MENEPSKKEKQIAKDVIASRARRLTCGGYSCDPLSCSNVECDELDCGVFSGG